MPAVSELDSELVVFVMLLWLSLAAAAVVVVAGVKLGVCFEILAADRS